MACAAHEQQIRAQRACMDEERSALQVGATESGEGSAPNLAAASPSAQALDASTASTQGASTASTARAFQPERLKLWVASSPPTSTDSCCQYADR